VGYSYEEFLHKKVWELGFLKDLISNQANLLELQQNEYIRYHDLPLETSGGKTIYVEFISNVYLVNNKKVIQCNIRDITERKTTDDILKQTMNRMITTEETLRREAALHLHDQVSQNLTALSLNLSYSLSQLPLQNNDKLKKRLDDSTALVNDTIVRIRDIMTELRPSVLDDYGLDAALRWSLSRFTERTSIPADFTGTELIPKLPVNTEYALFRMVQEALQNVLKHAHALHVSVELKESNGMVSLTIADDGIGFDLKQVKNSKVLQGFGLINIAERLTAMGGCLNIVTAPGEGTSIIITINRPTP
jgi:signal transduction histidine kinase